MPRRAAALALASALLGACGAPRDPVRALLAELEEAVESRDADAIRDRLAEDFRGPGGMDRQRAWETARRLLLGYEHASLEIYDVVAEPGEGGGRVSFWAEFSGRPRQLGGLSGLLPPGAVYRFELGLAEGEPGLVVASARWESGGDGVSSGSAQEGR